MEDELLSQAKGGADMLLSLFFDLDLRRANAPPEDGGGVVVVVVTDDELEDRDDDETRCGKGTSLMNSGRVSMVCGF